jgi:hypothetical protein
MDNKKWLSIQSTKKLLLLTSKLYWVKVTRRSLRTACSNREVLYLKINSSSWWENSRRNLGKDNLIKLFLPWVIIYPILLWILHGLISFILARAGWWKILMSGSSGARDDWSLTLKSTRIRTCDSHRWGLMLSCNSSAYRFWIGIQLWNTVLNLIN